MSFTIKEIASFFWEKAIEYCTEMEFRNPKNAKDFDKCWETWKAYEPQIKIDELKSHTITPRLD